MYSPLILTIARNDVFVDAPSEASLLYVMKSVFFFALILGLWVVAMSSDPDDVVAPPDNLPRLYLRLPDTADARIHHITVSDHYVVVFLNDGTSHRLLMRFADAVTEMDDTPGFSTHRSHWVAASCIDRGVRVGTKDMLRLTCGREVPVSKTYRAHLLDAGYFE